MSSSFVEENYHYTYADVLETVQVHIRDNGRYVTEMYDKFGG